MWYSTAPHPRLLRVRDPFGKLIVMSKGSVLIEELNVFEVAEEEG
jgi:hypothetical protein